MVSTENDKTFGYSIYRAAPWFGKSLNIAGNYHWRYWNEIWEWRNQYCGQWLYAFQLSLHTSNKHVNEVRFISEEFGFFITHYKHGKSAGCSRVFLLTTHRLRPMLWCGFLCFFLHYLSLTHLTNRINISSLSIMQTDNNVRGRGWIFPHNKKTRMKIYKDYEIVFACVKEKKEWSSEWGRE